LSRWNQRFVIFFLHYVDIVLRIIAINAYTMSANHCYPKQKNTSHLDTARFCAFVLSGLLLGRSFGPQSATTTRTRRAKLAYVPRGDLFFPYQFCRGSTPVAMHRLTARLLLILMLSGTFAPAALAISAESPHACCKRKPLHNHGGHSSEFQAFDCGNHDCCRPLTVSHRAQPRPSVSGCVSRPSGTLLQQLNPSYRIIDLNDFRSARAPPALSIA
jgi:hypothetical protein